VITFSLVDYIGLTIVALLALNADTDTDADASIDAASVYVWIEANLVKKGWYRLKGLCSMAVLYSCLNYLHCTAMIMRAYTQILTYIQIYIRTELQ
jgi:hypothetical protein